MKIPKRKKPRSHLPALSRMERELLAARLAAESRLSESAKVAVMRSMQAAANPVAETPAMAIAALDPDDRTGVQEAGRGYAQTLSAVGSRGKMALMLDSELDDLIASQGDEE